MNISSLANSGLFSFAKNKEVNLWDGQSKNSFG